MVKKIVSCIPLPPDVVRTILSSHTSSDLSDVEIVGVHQFPETKIIDEVKDALIIIGDFTFNTPITKKIVMAAKGVRLIQQPSVGYQHIDIDACREAGIPVANTAGANDISVAEHTIMLALSLIKKLIYANNKTQKGEWPQLDVGGGELFDKQYGIFGLGRIGREVAKRLIPFGVNIKYYDIVRLNKDEENELSVSYMGLEDILKTSDIISLHLPLTDKTKGIIGAREISLMKPVAILINVGRGELVDEGALASALREGEIAGAGIDVFSEEPIRSDNPLIGIENAILTPHIAGTTNEAKGRVIAMAFENIYNVLIGREDKVKNLL
jgi:phosphoglycerate dehydrogenase-like enzyme